MSNDVGFRKYDYIKQSERRRLVREAAGKSQACYDCGKVTKDLYWINADGKPVTMPRCAGCHENEVRRMTRVRGLEAEELREAWE